MGLQVTIYTSSKYKLKTHLRPICRIQTNDLRMFISTVQSSALPIELRSKYKFKLGKLKISFFTQIPIEEFILLGLYSLEW